jgi:hypothetical protein
VVKSNTTPLMNYSTSMHQPNQELTVNIAVILAPNLSGDGVVSLIISVIADNSMERAIIMGDGTCTKETITEDCCHDDGVTIEADDDNNTSVRKSAVYIPRPRKTRHEYRSFIIHKPVNVLSSTVDANMNNIVREPSSPHYGQRVSDIGVTLKDASSGACIDNGYGTVLARTTVYDIARDAGCIVSADSKIGLVGRLDFETSGIMLFTDDNKFASAVRDPIYTGDNDITNNLDNNEENNNVYEINKRINEYKMKEYLVQINPTKSFFNIESFEPSELEAELSSQLTFR